jgi:RES domain-containing protein
MRFWRISSSQPGAYAADDLTGEGPRRAGARWNFKGTPTVYASYHLATAVLETLVHVGNRAQPADRYVVTIDVDEAHLNDSRAGFLEVRLEDLPARWNENPVNPVSQSFGAELFKAGRLGFATPSTIVHEELNLVLNPLHPAFKRAVKAQIIRSFAFDPRLVSHLS